MYYYYNIGGRRRITTRKAYRIFRGLGLQMEFVHWLEEMEQYGVLKQLR